MYQPAISSRPARVHSISTAARLDMLSPLQVRSVQGLIVTIAQGDRNGNRETAASGIACQYCLRWFAAVIEQPSVSVHRVIDRGWKRMFGRESIVRDEHARPSRKSEMAGRLSPRVGRAKHK